MDCRHRRVAGALWAAVSGSRKLLDTPYRPGGWSSTRWCTTRRHHMNAYVRFRLALTENEPTIKPYDEGFGRN